MPTKGSFEGPGVWKDPETGMVSLTPGSQTWVPIGSKIGGETTGFVDPASRAHIEAYAAIKGEVLQQTAVTWTRAFESPAKFLHNGVDVPLGRRVTSDEAATLSRILQGAAELEIVILPIEDGVHRSQTTD